VVVVNVHSLYEDKSDGVKDSFCEEVGCVSDQFPRSDMKMFLGDFNANVGREDIFRPAIWSESSLEISNYNGARVVNFELLKT
jgi:hypothetical protein